MSGGGSAGAPRRAAPTDLQREHELELAWLVARLELLGDSAAVRTERESRAREAAGAAVRYSVDVIDRGGRRERRWPDLVIEGPSVRRAVEFERTAKGRARLERIVAAYRAAFWFDEVHFLAGGVDVARRLATALRAEPRRAPACGALAEPAGARARRGRRRARRRVGPPRVLLYA
jgi:hypothetical protein